MKNKDIDYKKRKLSFSHALEGRRLSKISKESNLNSDHSTVNVTNNAKKSEILMSEMYDSTTSEASDTSRRNSILSTGSSRKNSVKGLGLRIKTPSPKIYSRTPHGATRSNMAGNSSIHAPKSFYMLPPQWNAIAATPRTVKYSVLTKLHRAVQIGDIDLVKNLVANNVRVSPPTPKSGNDSHKLDEKSKDNLVIDINAQDGNGYTVLMNVAALRQSLVSKAIVDILLDVSSIALELKDNAGYTALHWAAYSDNAIVASKLIQAGANSSSQSMSQETPLHRACRFGAANVIKTLLEESHTNPYALNKEYHIPLEISGLNDGKKKPDFDKRGSARESLLTCVPTLSTCVLHHEDTLKHLSRKDHQESPARIISILNQIKDCNFKGYELHITSDFELASQVDVLRAHSKSYTEKVWKLAVKLSQDSNETPSMGKVIPFTPSLATTNKLLLQYNTNNNNTLNHPSVNPSLSASKPQETPINSNNSRNKFMIKETSSAVQSFRNLQCIQSDTCFSSGSLKASLRAAGSVKHAIDLVLSKKHRNALCVVRPPGHHAGVNGGANLALSCGFCIFNSVAIGALYALDCIPQINKVAIIDFDIHHGNGTEDIIRQVNRPDELFFASIHIFDKKKFEGETSFYPYSGDKSDYMNNIINISMEPLWRSDMGNPRRSVEPKLGRQTFRELMTEKVFPNIRSFNPDIIIVSAGFDGGSKDIGNRRLGCVHPGESGMNLEPRDFRWCATELQRIANVCCEGRLVSVLEGGYGSYYTSKGSRINSNSSATATTSNHINSSGASTTFTSNTDTCDPSNIINCDTLAKNVVAHLTGLLG